MILVIAALGAGCLFGFFNIRAQAEILSTRGVLAEAHIISSYKARRAVHADIMFTTEDGELRHESLSSCDFESLTPDMEYVHVLYDPEDPTFVRPAVCAGSNGLAWIALAGAVLFLGLDAMLIKGSLRARRSGA